MASLNETTLAYIAGFLDGDGSIMLQIKPHPETRYGYRITSTICLYQASAHADDLHWICDQLGTGYVSRRNDGMSELRLDGHERVATVLCLLQPYVRFKREQVEWMLEALAKLKSVHTPQDFLEVCWLADRIAHANYTSRRKHTAAAVEKVFRDKGWLSP